MARIPPLVFALLGLSSACSRPPVANAPGTLTIAVPYELTTLDPHARDKIGTFSILSNIYEPLVTLDRELRVVPCLAQSWENPDPSTWVFRLRPSVVFHDGRPFRAQDVVDTLERIRRSADLEMRVYVLDVEDVRALGELAVQIKTRVGSPAFVSKLSQILIVPSGTTSDTLARRANGTGPYAFDATEPGVVRLKRNEAYWGGAPAFAKAVFHLSRSADDATTGLLAGRYQLVQCDSRLTESRLQGRYPLRRQANLLVKYLGYDMGRDVTPFCSVRPNPFRQRSVRQAVDLALDRQALAAALSNYAVPASQPVPRLVFGHNPGIPEPTHDLERARSLLSSAGLAGGFQVVLHVRSVLAEAGSLVRQQLAQIGITVDVRPVSDVAFYDLADRRQVTFFLNRFGCTSGDASELLDDVLHSHDPARHLGTRNFGEYKDPALDREIERAGGLGDPTQRRQVLQRVMAQAMDELLLIPLYNDEDVYAMEPSVAFEPRADSVILVASVGRREPPTSAAGFLGRSPRS
jgi:peptide/nickel transport system substrate-binding protein